MQAFVSDEDLEDMEEHEDVNSWPQEMREAAEAKYGADLQEKWAGASSAAMNSRSIPMYWLTCNIPA